LTCYNTDPGVRKYISFPRIYFVHVMFRESAQEIVHNFLFKIRAFNFNSYQ